VFSLDMPDSFPMRQPRTLSEVCPAALKPHPPVTRDADPVSPFRERVGTKFDNRWHDRQSERPI